MSPRVETAEDINRHDCRYVAETVADRMGGESDVRILEDGAHGYAHTRIACERHHHDAECVEAADDYHDLPFFQRHPEAAVHVEPGCDDHSAVRNRGIEPLYPGH